MVRSVRLAWIAGVLGVALLGCGSSSSSAPASHVTPNTSGWWRDKVVYEVFVRSFADSNGDGIGDLKGLTAHLDYLNDGDASTSTDLGVDAVWLMPIHPSPSYHGYDVTDYRGVHPDYGTDADFDAFVAAAHRRGIKVILDSVLNHSSSQHPWFIDSRQGVSAARRGWYSWRDVDPGWANPLGTGSPWRALGVAYFYGIFNAGMPDLNLGNPAVEAELVDSMKSWMARGVDGFRLDAVRYYFESADGKTLVDHPDNHAFLKRVRQALQATYPDALLVAEAWAPVQIAARYYGEGDEVQLAFSFDLADAIKAGLTQGSASGVQATLSHVDDALAGKDRGYDAPFLSNHDQVRVARALGGDRAAARLAAALLLALPGTPFLYYGEELGMQGGAGTDDRQKRTPMRWTADPKHGFTTGTPWFDATEAAGVSVADQQPDPASQWNLYRQLVALRHARPALSRGTMTQPAITDGGTVVMALLRSDGNSRVLFVANLGTAAAGPFTVDAAGSPTVLLAEGLAAGPAAAAGKLTFPQLGARGFAYVSLE